MQTNNKIRVLIVDDSMVFREILSRGISSEPDIEVVATANDPFDARDKILKYNPDVMTCDVEMPKMNGIEFIRRLLPQYSLPIIVVSSVNGVVFDAMRSGAVDFVAKPDVNSVNGVEQFIIEIIEKVKIASKAKVVQLIKHIETGNVENKLLVKADKTGVASSINTDGNYYNPASAADSYYKYIDNAIIAIGASTGGTEAIYQVLKKLPPEVPGIVIVQHIPSKFSSMFAERMNSSTYLKVKEASNGDYVQPGSVLIAPGDKHMRVRKVGNQYKVECFEGNKINGHCPSVDVLFESVAKEAGKDAIGIILTGMGYDGARGLLAMKRKGARTIGQDEKSSVVYGMPKVAYDLGAVDKQTSLENIGLTLMNIVKQKFTKDTLST